MKKRNYNKTKPVRIQIIPFEIATQLLTLDKNKLKTIYLSQDYKNLKKEKFEIIKKNRNKRTDVITDVFCWIDEDESTFKFRLKKEFIMLQFIMPEFVPIIFFINYYELNRNDLKVNKLTNNYFLEIKLGLQNWAHELKANSIFHLSIFDSEITTDDFKFLYESMSNKIKFEILEFRKFLSRYLKLIVNDDTLIKNYKFLIRLYEFKLINQKYNFSLEYTFFLYFIVNLKEYNKELDNRFMEFNSLTIEQISKLARKHQCKLFHCVNFYNKKEIIKVMIENFIEVTRTCTIRYDQNFYSLKNSLKHAKFGARNIHYDQKIVNGVIYKKSINVYILSKLLCYLFNQSLIHID